MTLALVALSLSLVSSQAPLPPAPPSATAFVQHARVTAYDAPLTAGGSFGSAFGTTAVGGVMILAGTIRLGTTPQNQFISNMAMIWSGFLLTNFGPSIADAMMGDPWRLVKHGLLRLGLLVGSALLVALGPVGILGTFAGTVAWMGWVGAETLDSIHAPDRWADRTNAANGHKDPEEQQSGFLFRF